MDHFGELPVKDYVDSYRNVHRYGDLAAIGALRYMKPVTIAG